MNRHKRTVFTILGSVALLLNSTLAGQKFTDKGLEIKVSGFEIKDETIAGVFGGIARSYNVPIGFENITDASVPFKGPKITVELAKGTIRDILDEAVRKDSRYEWQMRDGVINVFPHVYKDPILETVVHKFKLDRANKIDASRILRESPELKAVMGKEGALWREMGVFPGDEPDYQLPRFSLDLHDVTLRTILNEIMKMSGNSYWSFYRYGDHNEYFSLKVS